MPRGKGWIRRKVSSMRLAGVAMSKLCSHPALYHSLTLQNTSTPSRPARNMLFAQLENFPDEQAQPEDTATSHEMVTSSQNQSLLFFLPAELRQEIFAYILTSEEHLQDPLRQRTTDPLGSTTECPRSCLEQQSGLRKTWDTCSTHR